MFLIDFFPYLVLTKYQIISSPFWVLNCQKTNVKTEYLHKYPQKEGKQKEKKRNFVPYKKS